MAKPYPDRAAAACTSMSACSTRPAATSSTTARAKAPMRCAMPSAGLQALMPEFHGAVRAQREFLSPLPAGHVRAGQSPLGRQQPLRGLAHSGRPGRGAPRRTSRGAAPMPIPISRWRRCWPASITVLSKLDPGAAGRRQCLARAGHGAALHARTMRWPVSKAARTLDPISARRRSRSIARPSASKRSVWRASSPPPNMTGIYRLLK